ncbi:hypothetical protein [Flavilitoribacter nigricans]|nr:hypothetical protein [Flavilitoribacter nigricans]
MNHRDKGIASTNLKRDDPALAIADPSTHCRHRKRSGSKDSGT